MGNSEVGGRDGRGRWREMCGLGLPGMALLTPMGGLGQSLPLQVTRFSLRSVSTLTCNNNVSRRLGREGKPNSRQDSGLLQPSVTSVCSSLWGKHPPQSVHSAPAPGSALTVWRMYHQGNELLIHGSDSLLGACEQSEENEILTESVLY